MGTGDKRRMSCDMCTVDTLWNIHLKADVQKLYWLIQYSTCCSLLSFVLSLENLP